MLYRHREYILYIILVLFLILIKINFIDLQNHLCKKYSSLKLKVAKIKEDRYLVLMNRLINTTLSFMKKNTNFFIIFDFCKIYFSIVNFSWEAWICDAWDTLTGIDFINECSNEGLCTICTCKFRQGPTIRSYGTIGFIRGTLQGAKKNSSRKASTFRQVTTKRTCERGGAGKAGLLRAEPGSCDHQALVPLEITTRRATTSSITCIPVRWLANVDDFTSFDGQVRSLGEC